VHPPSPLLPSYGRQARPETRYLLCPRSIQFVLSTGHCMSTAYHNCELVVTITKTCSQTTPPYLILALAGILKFLLSFAYDLL
jgi:hypothetical protein